MLYLCLILAGLTAFSDGKIGCKDMEGNDVDWFAAIKLPADFDDSKGYSFVYYDSSQPTWKMSKKSINSSNSAIGATITQIYKAKADKKMFYIAYNDDGPDTEVEGGRGHSKGVAVFDKNVGFWMVHSVPNYPPSNKYYYPETGTKFAQSFLCLSLDANFLKEVGEYMRFAQVTPFLSNLPESHKFVAPVLEDVINRKSLGRSDTVFTLVRSIETLEHKKAKLFSKHKKSNMDLWHGFIAPSLNTPMAVETWRNGAAKDVGTICDKLPVYDITTVTIMGSGYSNSKDHSKWGVSMDPKNPTVCIGDVNRQESQFKRGGGAVCIKDSKLWKVFRKSVGFYAGCKNETRDGRYM